MRKETAVCDRHSKLVPNTMAHMRVHSQSATFIPKVVQNRPTRTTHTFHSLTFSYGSIYLSNSIYIYILLLYKLYN